VPVPPLTGKNADWMAGFTNRDDLTLADITFPASHDAGLSHGVGGYTPYKGGGGYKADTICQYYDISGQLETGSRAFDLRIDTKGGVARCYHGDYLNMGGYGHSADEVFSHVNLFLQAHAGEIVIVRISHTKESVGVHRLIQQNIHSSRLVECGPRNLATVPLSRLRGKAIVIFDSKALAKTNPMGGLHRLRAYANKKTGQKNAPGEGLPICGSYAGKSADLKKVTTVALESGNQHGTHELTQGKHDHLFMVYWQEALKVEAKATKGNNERLKTLSKPDKAKGLHYNLDYLLNLHRGLPYVSKGPPKGPSSTVTLSNRAHHRPNWINLDFICDAVVDKIVEFNTELLPGGRGW